MRKVMIFGLTAAMGAVLAVVPAAASVGHRAAHTRTMLRTAWPPETLSGRIEMVLPRRGLVVVQTANGVPFDMIVGPRTRIRSDAGRMTLRALEQYENRNVQLRFIPEARGDVAQSIRVQG